MSMSNMSDTPVAEPLQDLLGRSGLARTILDLIVSARTNTALRIGVYGGWGEGKTSVLRLIETMAVRADIPVCWFSVWSAQTQADLWSALIDALGSLPNGSHPWTRFKNAAANVLSRTDTLAEFSSYTKAAHALGRLAAGSLRVGKDDALRVMKRIRQHSRIIILVDDVDRAETALVPKLLMGLHDLFDGLTRCAVVVALDPDAVSGSLGKSNPAWSNAPAFLEKIVQYPFRLPRPAKAQIQRLIREAIRQSELSVPEQAFLDLLGLLPDNPRKIKQFIRSLHRFQPALARHGDDEWNPSLLLLLELLRTGSGGTADELLQNRSFVQDFVAGWAFTRKEDMHDAGITKTQRARIDEAVANTMLLASEDERRHTAGRLSQITAVAAERLMLVTADDALRHASLDHEPPIMTLREFDEVHRSWLRERSGTRLCELVIKHAALHDRPCADVAEACMRAALKRRDQAIDEAAEAFDAKQAAFVIQRSDELLDLVERLIDDLHVFSDERFAGRIGLFLELRTQTSRFANRLSGEEYNQSRRRQRELVYRTAPMLQDRATDVLKELRPWNPEGHLRNAAGHAEMVELRERVADIFAELACQPLLDRFTRPGGIAGIGDFGTNPSDVWLLTDPSSPFHTREWRARLTAITAEPNESVSLNCFAYLDMLAGSPRTGLRSSPPAADVRLVEPLWRAAARVRPQESARWQAVDLMKRLKAGLADPNVISAPSWMTPEDEASQDGPGATPNE